MKIIRYQDKNGNIGCAARQGEGPALELTGDIYSSPQVTQNQAEVSKLLAPVVPSSIICIGLNYRRHAEETGARFPEQPIVFFKGVNSLLDPGEAIQIPQFMRSDEVDYECELAVVIGKPCKNVSRAACAEIRSGLYVLQRCQRTRLADQARRRAVVPRQKFRHIQPAGPVSCDAR